MYDFPDVVLLMDGRIATVLEVMEPGIYMVEVKENQAPDGDTTPIVEEEQIERLIHKSGIWTPKIS